MVGRERRRVVRRRTAGDIEGWWVTASTCNGYGSGHEKFQRRALTATAHNGSGPNKDHSRTALVLLSGNCGEVSQWSATDKKGTHNPETTEGGAIQETDTKGR
jgi:hypothetical protein